MKERTEKGEEYRIGRLLADEITSLEPDGPCLSGQELDELAEGKMPDERRDTAMAHIAACAICRHSYVITRRFVLDSAREQPRIRRFPRSYMAPLALAASLVLAIGLYRLVPRGDVAPMLNSSPESALKPGNTSQQEKPRSTIASVPKQSAEAPSITGLRVIAEILDTAGSGGHANLSVPSANHAGFASSRREEADLFHTGFAVVALNSSCRSGDTDAIRSAAASLDERVQRLDLADEKKELHRLTEDIVTRSTNPADCFKLLDETASHVEKRYQDNFYTEFGAWIALVLALAQNEEGKILKGPQFTAITAKASKLQKPSGVADRMKEMAVLVAGPMEESSYRQLQRLAEEIQKRF